MIAPPSSDCCRRIRSVVSMARTASDDVGLRLPEVARPPGLSAGRIFRLLVHCRLSVVCLCRMRSAPPLIVLRCSDELKQSNEDGGNFLGWNKWINLGYDLICLFS
ncbi:uncharacterized protein A4U43_C08F33590 [Asparagus officinalis]|nr:uncharacterized protein A4U43_C08F33590 [Asparagus officinalis]